MAEGSANFWRLWAQIACNFATCTRGTVSSNSNKISKYEVIHYCIAPIASFLMRTENLTNSIIIIIKSQQQRPEGKVGVDERSTRNASTHVVRAGGCSPSQRGERGTCEGGGLVSPEPGGASVSGMLHGLPLTLLHTRAAAFPPWP